MKYDNSISPSLYTKKLKLKRNELSAEGYKASAKAVES